MASAGSALQFLSSFPSLNRAHHTLSGLLIQGSESVILKQMRSLFCQHKCRVPLLEIFNVWDEVLAVWFGKTIPGNSVGLSPCENHSFKCYGCKTSHSICVCPLCTFLITLIGGWLKLDNDLIVFDLGIGHIQKLNTFALEYELSGKGMGIYIEYFN